MHVEGVRRHQPDPWEAGEFKLVMVAMRMVMIIVMVMATLNHIFARHMEKSEWFHDVGKCEYDLKQTLSRKRELHSGFVKKRNYYNWDMNGLRFFILMCNLCSGMA